MIRSVTVGLVCGVGLVACQSEGPSEDTIDTGTAVIDTAVPGPSEPSEPSEPSVTEPETWTTPDVEEDGDVLLATVVEWAPGASSLPFRDPHLAVNGVRGAGWHAGGLDVFSLGYAEGVDDQLVLSWGGAAVHDGPGFDLAVFENPFEVSPGNHFMDPVVVEVSPNGDDWVAFPHAYLAADPTQYSTDPALWEGFAGVTPVQFHIDNYPVHPLVPEQAGGDAFDLADLPGDDPVAAEILLFGAVAVRLSSAAMWIDSQTGALFPHDPISNGADIDGVYGWVRD